MIFSSLLVGLLSSFARQRSRSETLHCVYFALYRFASLTRAASAALQI
jgi:hypothetical protein